MPISIDQTDGTVPFPPPDLLPFSRPVVCASDDDPRQPRKVVPLTPPSEARCRQMAAAASVSAQRLAVDPGLVFGIAAELLSLDDRAFAERMRRMCGDDLGTALLSELLEAVDELADDLARANAAILTIRLRLAAGVYEGGRDVR